MTGCVFILLGGAIAAGAARVSERYGEPRGERIPNDLMTLSAAAIIAVYAAGFQRTKSAADEFQAQAARRRVHPSIASVVDPAKADHLSGRSPAQAASKFAIDAPCGLDFRLSECLGRIACNIRHCALEIWRQQSAPSQVQLPKSDARDQAKRLPTSPAGNSGGASQPAGVPAAPPADTALRQIQCRHASSSTHYKDGTYLGWGTCPPWHDPGICRNQEWTHPFSDDRTMRDCVPRVSGLACRPARW